MASPAALLSAATFSGVGAAAAVTCAACASPLPKSFSPASFMNDIKPMEFSCVGVVSR
jgi:hypothetical protein